MFLILLTGLVLLGAAVVLAGRAVAHPRLQAVARLRAIELYGFARDDERVGTDNQRRSPVTVLAEAIGRLASRPLTRVDPAQMRRDLLGAGLYNVTPEAYLGYRVLGTLSISAFVAATLPGADLSPLLVIAGIVLAPAMGWIGPRSLVQARARTRYDDIDRELPELIDLLVVTVEAGMGFSAAQAMCVRRLRGPLGREMRLALQEQTMGLGTDQAMANMLDRCDTDSMRSFVRSLQQGERLGVSIGSILRSLAVDLRLRRRHAAEERAQKAPIKILFPLIFLIFPSLFIVMLGPAGMTLMDALSAI